MGVIVYNDERHEYTLDGVLVPSVTQILKPLSEDEYRGVDPEVMAKAATLGKSVHRMIELDLKDDLDLYGLPDELTMWYAAWLNFRALSGFEMTGSEERVHSERYRYAGTLDMSGRLNGRRCLIDAKRTAQIPRTVGPQLAGYELAYREKHDIPTTEPIERYALHLAPSGKWKLVPNTDRNDARVFLSCLTINTWKNHK